MDKEQKSTPENLNQHFMEMAKIVSSRSTCNRKHVGAVLVKNQEVFST